MNEGLSIGDGTEEVEGEPIAIAVVSTAAPDSPSIIRKNEKDQTVPLWLITFTDVMALMLTFFVLLYAMSVPKEESWNEISLALSSNFSKDHAKPLNAGSQDVVNIDRISKNRALDLRYLKTLISGLLKKNNIDDVLIFQNGSRLIVSLPSELLFNSASANIGTEGKKMLFALSGVLERVKNRIEVVGHTDPRPITGTAGGYETNRELSLARAASVASILKNVGYQREITIRGMASARYDEMPENIPEGKAYSLSRRVDIILMDDDGYQTGIRR